MDTYNNCIIVIKNRRKTRTFLLEKMDIYLLNDRITSEQYDRLVAYMDEIKLE